MESQKGKVLNARNSGAAKSPALQSEERMRPKTQSRYKKSKRGKRAERNYADRDEAPNRNPRQPLTMPFQRERKGASSDDRKAHRARRVQLGKEYSWLFRIATDRKHARQREIRAQRNSKQVTPQQASKLLEAMNQEFQKSLKQLRRHPYWVEFVNRKEL